MGNLLQGFTTVVWSPSGPNVKYENSGTWARGDLYEPKQLCKVYPALAPLYHPFEREYDPEPVLNLMKKNNYALPLASVSLYCIFLAVGPRIMKNRPALPLKTAFAYWNLFLSIFSFYGVSRTVPHLLYRVFSESFEDSVCKSAHVGYGGGTTGLAVQIFILSKIPELLDTVFLILLKKEVIFLHWYHHITVLLYCWNSYVTESAAGLWFVAMNYSVHSIMYLHFYLQTSFPTPKDKTQKPKGGLYALARLMSRNAILITVMQIMQMFVGTSIVLACLYYNKYGVKVYKYKYSMSKCNNVDSNLMAGGAMYASYLALFVAFAFRRFALGKDDFKKPAAAQQDKKIK